MKITLFLAALWVAFAAFFPLDKKTALTGIVSDPSGTPLGGVAVKISKNRAFIAGTTTNAEGKYRLEVEPDTYNAEFSKEGFVSLRIVDVQVLANEESLLSVALEGSALEEIVVRDFKTSAKTYHSGRIRADATPAHSPMPTTSSPASEGVAMLGSRDAASAKRKTSASAESKPSTTGAPTSASPAVSYEVVEMDGEMIKAHVVFSPETYEERIEIIEDEAIVPPSGGTSKPTPRAGLLTAGEWNDLHNWNRHWTDLLADGEIEQYQTMYGLYPKQRYTVLLTNEQNFPMADVVVNLQDGTGKIIWEARTDNTGKAELWAGLFDKKGYSNLKIEAAANGQQHTINQPKPAVEGLNFLKIKAECAAPKNVDIVWAVDATGSMGDEIEYLKTELLDVIGRAQSRNPDLAFRMGTVFYRDKGDEYITKSSGLSSDIAKTVDFIKKQYADGGGDYPEAVHSALEEVVFGQKWSKNAIARICFLVLDASPHQSPEVNASLQKSIREAARLGIRIVPVAASGIQKDTEFLMKFFGLATNGTYVFLTDHSGIGGKHLEPTSEEYKVELLNDLLVRLITEYTTFQTCEGKSEILFVGDPQQQRPTWQAFYYPNPVSTQFTLELPSEVQSVAIFDAEGKVIRKLEKPHGGLHNIVVSDLAAGYYTIRILKDGVMQSGKLMVVRV